MYLQKHVSFSVTNKSQSKLKSFNYNVKLMMITTADIITHDFQVKGC